MSCDSGPSVWFVRLLPTKNAEVYVMSATLVVVLGGCVGAVATVVVLDS